MPLARAALFPLCATVLLVACKPPVASTPATKPNIDVYPMRGIIEQLPSPAAPRTLIVHHEATKDMESMTMAFTLDTAVPLTGLAVGDKISFRYEIDWNQHLDHVTKIEKLPADTVLNFGPPATAQ
jgi:Cu/Ag efflux protein CusF